MGQANGNSRTQPSRDQGIEGAPKPLNTPPGNDDFNERVVVGRMIYEGCPNAQPIAPGGWTKTRENARDRPEPDRSCAQRAMPG